MVFLLLRVLHLASPATLASSPRQTTVMLEAKLSEAALLKRLLDGAYSRVPAFVRAVLTRRGSREGTRVGREL